MEHEHEESKRTPYHEAMLDEDLTAEERFDKVIEDSDHVERVKSPKADEGGPANPDSGGSPTRVTGGATPTGGTTGGDTGTAV